ncbi:MAG: threonine/serine dehydratase [Gammaproteobacteria bacterium]|nr:threonine/serine dehydratase [Gammaproteobacteria bacterium]
MEDTAARATEAAARLSAFVRHTPLRYSDYFSDATGARVYFKLENRQLTGSFKLRGALNRLLTLTDAERRRGCVAASSGNHGAAVASAMRTLGIAGVIFVPENTSGAKVDVIRSYGGDVRFFGVDGLDTEMHARQYAAENGMFYVSPYNDEAVIAGQGTCGIEIADELPDIDAVIVAVGGGGLISGVGSVLKARNDKVAVIGCQPAASPVMARSIAAGHVIEMDSEPTLSDGTAGGIESDAITFAINQAVVDEFLVVSEEQIVSAMRLFMEREGDVIEGAAGVAVAALLEKQSQLRGKRVAVIICGGNIAEDRLARIKAGDR